MNEANEAEELMDVEFPIALDINSSNTDDDENSTSPTSAPLIDIMADGWDNDAILNCLERSCALHDYSKKEGTASVDASVGTLDLRQFEFVARPNRRFDSERDVVPLDSVAIETENRQSLLQGETTSQDESSVKGDQNMDFQVDNWTPSSLPLPSWASDPVTRL